MTNLALTSDVEASLGRSLTTAEGPRAAALLLLASAHVLSVTGRRFAAGDYTVGRKVRSSKVRLPARGTVTAIRDIDQCTGTATAVTGFTTRGRTVYGLTSRRFVEVDITVTEGVPEDVTGVVAGVVAATMAGPAVGTASESTGPFSVSYVNSAGKVWLNASDRVILAKYVDPAAALDLTP